MSDFDRSKWMEVIVTELAAAGVDEELIGKVKICLQYAETAIALDSFLPSGKIGGVLVNRVNIKIATRNPRKTTLVVAGTLKREPVVTFHTGEHGISVFHEFMQRQIAGAIEWKPDTPVHAAETSHEFNTLPPLPGA